MVGTVGRDDNLYYCAHEGCKRVKLGDNEWGEDRGVSVLIEDGTAEAVMAPFCDLHQDFSVPSSPVVPFIRLTQ